MQTVCVRAGDEGLGHCAGVLVGEDRQDGDHGAAGGGFGQGLGEGAGAVGVVGGVEEDRRVVRHPLEATGNLDLGGDRLDAVRIELAEEGLGRRAGEREVAPLEGAEQPASSRVLH